MVLDKVVDKCASVSVTHLLLGDASLLQERLERLLLLSRPVEALLLVPADVRDVLEVGRTRYFRLVYTAQGPLLVPGPAELFRKWSWSP